MFFDIEDSLDHIKETEKKIKMRRLIDKIQIVLRNHMEESTDFLDPYERSLARSILNRSKDLGYKEYGGLEVSERKIIAIFPYYMEDLPEEDIKALRVKGDIRDLSHKDFLGALMNLGINRNKIGDILLHRDYTDIICKREIADFVNLNLSKVGNKNVDVSESSLDDLTSVDLEYKEVFRTFSSLRIDSYISAAYNLSRSNSMKIIKSGGVKVNWQLIDKISFGINEGDMISVKGLGRSTLYSVEGLSKKNNIKAIIRILI